MKKFTCPSVYMKSPNLFKYIGIASIVVACTTDLRAQENWNFGKEIGNSSDSHKLFLPNFNAQPDASINKSSLPAFVSAPPVEDPDVLQQQRLNRIANVGKAVSPPIMPPPDAKGGYYFNQLSDEFFCWKSSVSQRQF